MMITSPEIQAALDKEWSKLQGKLRKVSPGITQEVLDLLCADWIRKKIDQSFSEEPQFKVWVRQDVDHGDQVSWVTGWLHESGELADDEKNGDSWTLEQLGQGGLESLDYEGCRLQELKLVRVQ